MSDLVLIILIGGGSAIGVGALGLVALRFLRGRSLRLKLFAGAMTTVLSMAAGVIMAAQKMFLDRHDLGVVFIVCAASGLVALAMAIPLARNVTADSRALRSAMRALGDSEPEYELPSSPRALGRHAAPGLVERAAPATLATAELDDILGGGNDGKAVAQRDSFEHCLNFFP